MNKPLRIAILTHSTNPRGGVVHALELGEALGRLGHEPTVYAPDATGAGFFRNASCRTACVAAAPADRDTFAMVESRIADYVRYFESARNQIDVWHAQDGISGNALATLKERGLIQGFARTVHHVDTFDDDRLSALQLRSITAADGLFVVSRMWQQWLGRELGRDAHHVGNGVDMERFSSTPDATDAVLRLRLGLSPGTPVFLAVGGVEERKNTIRLLEAFRTVHAQHPTCRLMIAGGASLLDHGAYQQRFFAALTHSGLPDDAVIPTGPWPQELMPALYRAATTLVFPSMKEGFGLVVLEAMASGVPVVTSRVAPFTEYLGHDDVIWCDPLNPAAIAEAMSASLDARSRERLVARGLNVARRHNWRTTAQAHLAVYDRLREAVHA
jgi:glycosyltransferase-like protein